MNTVPLSDWVKDLESGSRPKGGIKEGVGQIPSLGAEHLSESGGFDFSKLKLIPDTFFRSLNKGKIKPSDILVVKDGATTGKVSFVGDDFPHVEAAINEHVFRIEVNSKKADAEFVFRFLQSPAGQAGIMKDFRGATVGGIGRTFLDKVLLPDFNLQKQRRIAAILNKADAIRRKRERMIVIADDFLRSAFLDMFGDPVSNPKNLPLASIKELARIVTGNTPPRNDPENYGPGIEWIKSDNINSLSHYLTPAEETLTDKGRLIGRTVPAGSTLVTCIAGSPNSIGNAAIADREVAFNQQLNAAIPHRDVNPFFLYCHFLVGKSLIQSASTNSMKGMVSKGKFQEIRFFRPSPADQQKFGQLFQKVMEVTQGLQGSFMESQALFGSLAQRAFRGEL